MQATINDYQEIPLDVSVDDDVQPFIERYESNRIGMMIDIYFHFDHK